MIGGENRVACRGNAVAKIGKICGRDINITGSYHMTNTTYSHEIITREYEKCPWLDEVRWGVTELTRNLQNNQTKIKPKFEEN